MSYKRITVVGGNAPKDAGNIMKLIVGLAKPIIIANKLDIGDFFEIDYERPNSTPGVRADALLGVYYPTTHNLGVLLKDHLSHNFKRGTQYWRHYADLMAVILHELTHAILDQREGDGNAGHNAHFYETMYEVQHQYYEAYTRSHDRMSSFVPNFETINNVRKSLMNNNMTNAVGMPQLRGRVSVHPQDFFVEVRQWAIERKLDSEMASDYGDILDHYHGTGVDEPSINGVGHEPALTGSRGRRGGRGYGGGGGGWNPGVSGGGWNPGAGGGRTISFGDGGSQFNGDINDLIRSLFGQHMVYQDTNTRYGARIPTSKGKEKANVQPLCMHTNKPPSLGNLFHTMAKKLFGGKDDRSTSSKEFTDKHGYMGCAIHPKNKSFVEGLVKDVYFSGSSGGCYVGRPEKQPVKMYANLIPVEQSRKGYSKEARKWEDDEIENSVKAAKAVKKSKPIVPKPTQKAPSKEKLKNDAPKTTQSAPSKDKAKQNALKAKALSNSSKSKTRQSASRPEEDDMARMMRERRLARFDSPSSKWTSKWKK